MKNFNSIKWFSNVLGSRYDINVKKEAISIEAIELYHEEIDPAMVPKKYLEMINDPCIFETMIYEDIQGNEWLGYAAINQSGAEPQLNALLKNGEIVFIQENNQ